jgi:hypothetical protein
LLAAAGPLFAAERPPESRLLPDSTVAMVSIPDVPEMAGRFMNTAFGRMSQDPQMKPLLGQLYGSLTELVSQAQERIALTLPELLALPQGELTVALVAPKDAPLGLVLLLDAGDQVANARKLLDRLAAVLEQSGARKSEHAVGRTTITIYDGVGPQQRKVAYFEKDATIVLGNDAEVVKQVLAVWNRAKADTLADNRNYAAIMSRCRGARDETPQAIWYADLVGILRGMTDQNAGAQMVVALLPALGLDGLSAVGGTVTFDAGQFDAIAHVHLLLENPRSGVVKMLALEPGEVKPERWVPNDVASYMTLHWNFETTYKTAATVYDSFRGDGALARDLGQWISARADIDFQQEILPALEGRVTLFSWVEQPVTIFSQAQLLALRLKDTALANKALGKLVAKYPERLASRSYAGKVYYQLQPPPGREPPADAPSTRRALPQPCFSIVDDYLMLANRASILEKAVLTLADGSKSLADELDFKLILGKIQRQSGSAKPALITFSRPEEGLRYYYDLIVADNTRQGLHRAAENNQLMRALDTALQQNPLPPFEVLERYLAPGGGMVVDDDTGWHYMTFSLRRKTD